MYHTVAAAAAAVTVTEPATDDVGKNTFTITIIFFIFFVFVLSPSSRVASGFDLARCLVHVLARIRLRVPRGGGANSNHIP